MISVPSATTWGSPTATKYALLIHGLTSSSHTWHRVASSLAAQGYFVTAPDLVGHGFRVSTDYRLDSIAEDLRPYLEARNYSLIIGHSLGALTALALSTLLPQSHPTAIILVDPPMQLSPEQISFYNNVFTDACAEPRGAKEYCAENPLWKHEDGISRELGPRLCSVDTVHNIFEQNKEWNFLKSLQALSSNWKVTVLVADPTLYAVCPMECFQHHPHIRVIMIPAVGHWIQHDAPNVIVEEALKMVAELESA